MKNQFESVLCVAVYSLFHLFFHILSDFSNLLFLHIRGAYDKFPDFYVWALFFYSTLMKLESPSK